MHPLVRTVALRGSGAIKFKEDYLRIGRLKPLMTGISAGISGCIERECKGHHDIQVEWVMVISLTCLVVIFRMEIVGQPNQYQIVMFQMDPLRQKLTWNHVVTFDGRGVLDVLDKGVNFSDYRFTCSPFTTNHADCLTTQIGLQFRWIRYPSKGSDTLRRSFFVTEKKIAVCRTNDWTIWDGCTHWVQSGYLQE